MFARHMQIQISETESMSVAYTAHQGISEVYNH